MNWKLISTTAFAFGIVTGCGTTSSPTVQETSSAYSPTTPATAPMICNADAAQAAIGQKTDDRVAEKFRVQAGAKSVRVLSPNSVMTTEYNPQRLNLLLDEQGVVASVNCG